MSRVENGIVYWDCPNCGQENIIEHEEILSECELCANLCDVCVNDDGEVEVEEF